MRSFLVTSLLLAGCFAGRAAAQILPGDNGLYLRTQSGGAGTFCRGFSCTAYKTGSGPNEQVTLEIRGPLNAPFWLFFAPTATWCLQVPGIKNSLVLTPPIFFAASGTLSLGDPILACPGGLQKITFTVALPPIVSFAIQDVVMAYYPSGPQATFSAAIDVVVK